MSILDAPALHLHALNALQQSDILLAHAPNIGLKEPHTIADVTEEWLTSILNREIADAKVERMSFIEAHEGMTNRHRLSLTWNAAGQAANLPTAIFVKVTPSHGHLREILAMLHMAELECNVYNTVQEDLKDVIPQAYYCRSYPGGRFIIVMEDITARGGKVHWMGDDCSVEYAYAVAVALSKIHARFWNSPRFETDMIWVRPRSRRFGELWLESYFEVNRAKFMETEYHKMLSPYVQELLKKWQQHYKTLYKYWETKPMTIVHGDSHFLGLAKLWLNRC